MVSPSPPPQATNAAHVMSANVAPKEIHRMIGPFLDLADDTRQSSK
ncbi:Hypothetical protein A7982_05536 [Minicystis rosea]|nr:Hypothetical protein A7982_05536 [Minicystis rosea]